MHSVVEAVELTTNPPSNPLIHLLGRLVIDTLSEASKADPDRKCFRLIGGVLVERTVKEVLPALQTNLEGLKQILETLLKQYKQKETELQEFQREYAS